MAAEWTRVANSTITNYIRKEEDNTLRNRKLTAMIKSKGRITYNWSGTNMEWPVKYRRYKPNTFAQGSTLAYSQKNRRKKASLDWRGYAITDSMTKAEFLKNRGKEAIINEFSNMATDLKGDMDESFAEEFYIDGSAAENSERIHGIETFMGADLVAGNGAGAPTNTNFAGLSCVLGAYGGSWTGGGLLSWPNGRGDTQYDFWSPLVVDYGSTLFSATPKWKNNCVEAIAFAIIKTKKNKSQKGSLDLILVDEEMYRVYLAEQRSKQQINVDRGQASALVSLGFTDVINQDGTDITTEYGIPPQVGYGFSFDNMEMRSMQGQLFIPDGPTWDGPSQSWRLSLDFYGNVTWNPRYFCKLANLTSPGAALV